VGDAVAAVGTAATVGTAAAVGTDVIITFFTFRW
jgi:hypothetical protein